MSGNLGSRFLSVEFRRALGLSLLVILAVFAVGVLVGQQLPREEQRRLQKAIEGIPIQTHYIFLNNYLIVMGSVTPFAGIAFHLFVQYSTGSVFGAVATLHNVHPFLLVLAAMPVLVPEYTAYVLALAESSVLSYAVLRRRVELALRLRRQTWKTAVITGGVLAVAAAIEVSFIRLLR